MDKAVRTPLHTPVVKSSGSQWTTSTIKARTQDCLGKAKGEESKLNLARKEPGIDSNVLKIFRDCRHEAKRTI